MEVRRDRDVQFMTSNSWERYNVSTRRNEKLHIYRTKSMKL
jgi:hypothetical protein